MCTNFTSCCKPLIKYHENLVNAISDVKSTSTRGNVLIRGHITSVSWRKGRNPVPDRNAGKTKRSSEALSLCTPSHEMKEQAAAGRRKRMDTATPTHCRARLQQGQGQMQPQKFSGRRKSWRKERKNKNKKTSGISWAHFIRPPWHPQREGMQGARPPLPQRGIWGCAVVGSCSTFK